MIYTKMGMTDMKLNRTLMLLSLFIISLAVIFSFNINSVSASSSVIYVNAASGNDANVGSQTLPKKTIGNAIKTAQPGNPTTINIASGTYSEHDITITRKTLILTGESRYNTVIDAKNKGRIFLITTGSIVSIINLSLVNGNSYSEPVNRGGPQGGAIYNNGNLKLSKTTFANNRASNGGAIYNSHGSSANPVTLSITNSKFDYNTAALSGGGINNLFDNLIVTYSTFVSNKAYLGGAIHSYGTLTLNNNIFSSNVANEGGALVNLYGRASLKTDKFSYNVATGQGGGAIITSQNTMTVTDSTFTHNTSKQGGGAIHNCNLALPKSGDLNVINCIFTSNKATNDAGGAIKNGKGNLIVTNSKFIGNSAISAGAVVNLNGNAALKHDTFIGNVATLFGGGAVVNGQTKLNIKSNLVVTDSSFISNAARKAGGALMNDAIGYSVSKSTTYVSNCTFNNNKVLSNDGGGAIRNGGGILTVTKSLFVNNRAVTYGGAIFSISGISRISYSRFSGNTAPVYGGGAIFNSQGNLQATRNTFISNRGDVGGAIYNFKQGTATITYNNFVSNSANRYGGAIFNYGNASVISNGFSSNYAGKKGANVYNAGGNLVLR